MNKEIFEAQSTQIKAYIRDKWPKITEDDLKQINGRYDQLVAKLQQRYGFTREEAEENLSRWDYSKTRTYATTEEPVRSSDSTSLLKWLLLAAIPLALIATYLSHENAKKAEEPQPAVQQDVMTSRPALDQNIVRDIRANLERNRSTISGFDTIRIESVNGAVTLSGSVPSREDRDAIFNIVRGISGVTQVNNQLEIR